MKLKQEWLKRPDVAKLFGAIQAAGGEARFIGGCVRDAILGRELGDFDVATTLLPQDVMKAVETAGCKAIPTGIEHGTVTVVINHKPFEVTTLRRDVTTDGRHAVVAYTDSWQEDAARRDFTMNALFCDAEGNVSDYYGGLQDLAQGFVRFVGVPSQRIEEDVLRILRFFRFHAHYGKAEMDTEALAACKAKVALLPSLSAERVRTELLKLLKASNPVPSWQAMLDIGALAALKLPLDNTAALDKLVAQETALDAPDALRRLFVLCSGDISEIAKSLRLSNAEFLRLKHIKGVAPALDKVFKAAYFAGPQAIIDQLVIDGRADKALIDELSHWHKPTFPIGGAALKTLGVAEGPEMGRILNAVEKWWVEHDFAPNAAACEAQARSLI